MALLESGRLDDLDLWTFFAADELKAADSASGKGKRSLHNLPLASFKRPTIPTAIKKRMLDGKDDSPVAVALSLHVRSGASVPVSASPAGKYLILRQSERVTH